MEERFYPRVEADPLALARELRQRFERDGYEVQTLTIGVTVVVQARKIEAWRTLTGLSAGLTVSLTPEPAGLRVEVGMERWLDKAAVALAVSVLSFGVLFALPAFGAFRQQWLTETTWDFIESYLATHSANYIPPAPNLCAVCSHPTPLDAAFCPTCGTSRRADPRRCPICETPLATSSSRFCHRCGQPVPRG